MPHVGKSDRAPQSDGTLSSANITKAWSNGGVPRSSRTAAGQGRSCRRRLARSASLEATRSAPDHQKAKRGLTVVHALAVDDAGGGTGLSADLFAANGP